MVGRFIGILRGFGAPRGRPTGRPFGYRRAASTACAIALAGGCLVLGVGAVAESVAGRVSGRAVLNLTQPRVVVLKHKRLLHLFDGPVLVRSYPMDLGSRPMGAKRLAEDGRTPEGRFRVVSKNAESGYHRFLGIDYPDVPAAEWGLGRGLLSRGEFASIVAAHQAGQCPEWGTPLGGGVGIHGGRAGRDWTAGCIAVSDEHVEELFGVLRIGDPVEILP